MKRRTLLAATSSLAVAGAGCLEAVTGEEGDPAPHESAESDADGRHHLYVENLDDRVHRVSLEVVRRRNDETVIDGTYELADERGGEFRDVGEWGETYDVTATVDSGVAETFTWTIDSCEGSELEGGSRNGSVRVEPGDDLSFLTDSCDEVLAGAAVPTGPANRFEIDDDRCEGASSENAGDRHHLYVENLDDEARRLSLRVTRCDEPVVEGTYDVPDERGIEFENVALWGDRIVLEVSLESGPSDAFSWVVDGCRDISGQHGSRNASVRLLPDGAAGELELVVDDCDEIVAGAEVPIGPAGQFEADEENESDRGK